MMGFCKVSKPGLIHRVFSCLASTLLLGFTAHVLADVEPSLTLQGFGTIGAVRTTSNDAEFVRDLSQPRGARQNWDARVDSLLGAQANWRINAQLEAVVQAVSRYRYDRTFAPEISWVYLK